VHLAEHVAGEAEACEDVSQRADNTRLDVLQTVEAVQKTGTATITAIDEGSRSSLRATASG
jgi:hypothetical protein